MEILKKIFEKSILFVYESATRKVKAKVKQKVAKVTCLRFLKKVFGAFTNHVARLFIQKVAARTGLNNNYFAEI